MILNGNCLEQWGKEKQFDAFGKGPNMKQDGSCNDWEWVPLQDLFKVKKKMLWCMDASKHT